MTFRDPQTPSTLSVVKQDQESGTTLDGATFALYSETNGTPGLQPGGDTLVGECTTAGGTACSVQGLAHGTYYWLETKAPQGYESPAGAQSGPIVVAPENAGTTFPVTVIGDPQKRSALSVVKHDAETGAVVAGATFESWRDADGNGRYDAASDTKVGACTTTAEACGVDPVGFGTYFWVETKAPQGYQAPEGRGVRADRRHGRQRRGETSRRSRSPTRRCAAGSTCARPTPSPRRRWPAPSSSLYADTDRDGLHDPAEPMVGAPRTTGAKGRITWDKAS
ncbi:hypothetical protein G5V59_25885 [Nocardioides sp. W3-2-3]|uniref:MSCRAMM family protein n=1 Tax=Nocardioides convexus TaxID=2712224 RepID=UPI00241871B8|nr:SpaA isopeptide-forming pilin-related protein [Nocardioides convexus]NHA01910.1 hypothetical protein [Nocardioides convexus]